MLVCNTRGLLEILASRMSRVRRLQSRRWTRWKLLKLKRVSTVRFVLQCRRFIRILVWKKLVPKLKKKLTNIIFGRATICQLSVQTIKMCPKFMSFHRNLPQIQFFLVSTKGTFFFQMGGPLGATHPPTQIFFPAQNWWGSHLQKNIIVVSKHHSPKLNPKDIFLDGATHPPTPSQPAEMAVAPMGPPIWKKNVPLLNI